MKTKAITAAGVAAALDDGVSKDEAAELLGCSIRQVQRLAKAGRVRRRELPKGAGDRTAPVIYSRRDLLAVKHGERPAKPVNLPGDPKTLSVNRAGALESLLRHLPIAPALPPWLSIPEASKYSGLPAAFLRARAPELVAVGAAVNVGRGNTPRWRLLRAQLEKGFPVSPVSGN